MTKLPILSPSQIIHFYVSLYPALLIYGFPTIPVSRIFDVASPMVWSDILIHFSRILVNAYSILSTAIPTENFTMSDDYDTEYIIPALQLRNAIAQANTKELPLLLNEVFGEKTYMQGGGDGENFNFREYLFGPLPQRGGARKDLAGMSNIGIKGIYDSLKDTEFMENKKATTRQQMINALNKYYDNKDAAERAAQGKNNKNNNNSNKNSNNSSNNNAQPTLSRILSKPSTTIVSRPTTTTTTSIVSRPTTTTIVPHVQESEEEMMEDPNVKEILQKLGSGEKLKPNQFAGLSLAKMQLIQRQATEMNQYNALLQQSSEIAYCSAELGRGGEYSFKALGDKLQVFKEKLQKDDDIVQRNYALLKSYTTTVSDIDKLEDLSEESRSFLITLMNIFNSVQSEIKINRAIQEVERKHKKITRSVGNKCLTWAVAAASLVIVYAAASYYYKTDEETPQPLQSGPLVINQTVPVILNQAVPMISNQTVSVASNQTLLNQTLSFNNTIFNETLANVTETLNATINATFTAEKTAALATEGSQSWYYNVWEGLKGMASLGASTVVDVGSSVVDVGSTVGSTVVSAIKATPGALYDTGSTVGSKVVTAIKEAPGAVSGGWEYTKNGGFKLLKFVAKEGTSVVTGSITSVGEGVAEGTGITSAISTGKAAVSTTYDTLSTGWDIGTKAAPYVAAVYTAFGLAGDYNKYRDVSADSEDIKERFGMVVNNLRELALKQIWPHYFNYKQRALIEIGQYIAANHSNPHFIHNLELAGGIEGLLTIYDNQYKAELTKMRLADLIKILSPQERLNLQKDINQEIAIARAEMKLILNKFDNYVQNNMFDTQATNLLSRSANLALTSVGYALSTAKNAATTVASTATSAALTYATGDPRMLLMNNLPSTTSSIPPPSSSIPPPSSSTVTNQLTPEEQQLEQLRTEAYTTNFADVINAQNAIIASGNGGYNPSVLRDQQLADNFLIPYNATMNQLSNIGQSMVNPVNQRINNFTLDPAALAFMRQQRQQQPPILPGMPEIRNEKNNAKPPSSSSSAMTIRKRKGGNRRTRRHKKESQKRRTRGRR